MRRRDGTRPHSARPVLHALIYLTVQADRSRSVVDDPAKLSTADAEILGHVLSSRNAAFSHCSTSTRVIEVWAVGRLKCTSFGNTRRHRTRSQSLLLGGRSGSRIRRMSSRHCGLAYILHSPVDSSKCGLDQCSMLYTRICRRGTHGRMRVGPRESDTFYPDVRVSNGTRWIRIIARVVYGAGHLRDRRRCYKGEVDDDITLPANAFNSHECRLSDAAKVGDSQLCGGSNTLHGTLRRCREITRIYPRKRNTIATLHSDSVGPDHHGWYSSRAGGYNGALACGLGVYYGVCGAVCVVRLG